MTHNTNYQTSTQNTNQSAANKALELFLFMNRTTAYIKIGSEVSITTPEKCCDDVFPKIIKNLQVGFDKCKKSLENCKRSLESNQEDLDLQDLMHFLVNEMKLYKRAIALYKDEREKALKWTKTMVRPT